MRLVGVLFVALAAAGVGNGLANIDNASEARAISRPTVVEKIVYEEKEVVREVRTLTPECEAAIGAADRLLEATKEISASKGAFSPALTSAKNAVVHGDSAQISRAERDLITAENNFNAALREAAQYEVTIEDLMSECSSSY